MNVRITKLDGSVLISKLSGSYEEIVEYTTNLYCKGETMELLDFDFGMM